MIALVNYEDIAHMIDLDVDRPATKLASIRPIRSPLRQKDTGISLNSSKTHAAEVSLSAIRSNSLRVGRLGARVNTARPSGRVRMPARPRSSYRSVWMLRRTWSAVRLRERRRGGGWVAS